MSGVFPTSHLFPYPFPVSFRSYTSARVSHSISIGQRHWLVPASGKIQRYGEADAGAVLRPFRQVNRTKIKKEPGGETLITNSSTDCISKAFFLLGFTNEKPDDLTFKRLPREIIMHHFKRIRVVLSPNWTLFASEENMRKYFQVS